MQYLCFKERWDLGVGGVGEGAGPCIQHLGGGHVAPSTTGWVKGESHVDSEEAAVEHQLMTPGLCPRLAEKGRLRLPSRGRTVDSAAGFQFSGASPVVPGEWMRKGRVCLGYQGTCGNGLGGVSEENDWG